MAAMHLSTQQVWGISVLLTKRSKWQQGAVMQYKMEDDGMLSPVSRYWPQIVGETKKNGPGKLLNGGEPIEA